MHAQVFISNEGKETKIYDHKKCIYIYIFFFFQNL